MLAGTTTDNRLEHGRGCRAGVRSEKYAMPNLKTVAVANILGMAVGSQGRETAPALLKPSKAAPSERPRLGYAAARTHCQALRRPTPQSNNANSNSAGRTNAAGVLQALSL
jgi:hypothetical protein